MLTRVTLENFKRFGAPVTFELAPVTLILGPNSVGKSCLFKALRLLAQSWDHYASIGTLTFEGDRVTLNNFSSAIHRNDKSLPLRLGITDTKQEGDLLAERTAVFEFRGDGANLCNLTSLELSWHSAEPSWTASVSRRRDADDQENLLVLDFNIEQRDTDGQIKPAGPIGEWFARIRDEYDIPPDACRVASVSMSLSSRQEVIKEPIPFESFRPRSEPSDLDTPAEELRAAPSMSESNSDLMQWDLSESSKVKLLLGNLTDFVAKRVSELLSEIRDTLRRLSHIGRSRATCPEYSTIYNEDTEELAVGKGAQNLSRILATQSGIVMDLNTSLRDLASADPRGRLPYYRVDVSNHTDWNVWRIRLAHCDANGGHLAWTRVTEVGAGIGQIMPILVEWSRLRKSAYDRRSRSPGSDNRRTLLMEQPELHLHPAHQTALMSMLAGLHPDTHEPTCDAADVPQVIVETHSEHMVMRAQTLVRSGLLGPEKVSILALSVGIDDETVVQRIPLGEDGEFEDFWPDGFFDERLDEQHMTFKGKSGESADEANPGSEQAQ